jgi:pyruvate/2-oxoglutarate dehydrogenase complex dihydrolipoamide dehydrogenase (E3) component
MADTYDVVVVGGGAAGENLAGRCAKGGLSVVLVESELVGGECSFWACLPSKALLRPGEVLAAARRVPGARSAVTGTVDAAAALERRDEITTRWDDRYQVQWLGDNDVELVRGHGRLAGARTVEVAEPDGAMRTLVAARAVVLATGTVAARPPIPGLAETRVWDSRNATSASAVPKRLIVLGGGVVGVEMAQAWRRLGAESVTVVEGLGRLLPRHEPFAGEQLRAALADEGIDVRTAAKVVRIARAGDDAAVEVTIEDGPTLSADELLVAVGRHPATDDIGLETIGLPTGRSIDVDDHLRATAVPDGWLYAIGDVNGRALLTHMGKYQARIAADVILGTEITAWADERAVPSVVFTDPQIGSVGRTEAEARERGIDVRVVSRPLTSVAATATHGEGIDGTAQLVIDQARRVVVGATFVGPDVAELVHAATIAIVGEVPLDVLWHAVPSFPTLSELWLRFLEEYGL